MSPWVSVAIEEHAPGRAGVHRRRVQGQDPLLAEGAVGGHEVRLSMPEYYEWRRDVQVEEKPLNPSG